MKSILKINFILFFIFNLTVSTYAQNTKVDEKISIALADEQLNAYNKRDIEAFLKPYSDTVKVYRYPSTLLYKGKETMRKSYAGMFEKTPDLHCKLVNRIVLNDKVIDQEEVTIKKDKPNFRAIAIYTIKDGKIVEVNFMR
jgi:hypothetical protein